MKIFVDNFASKQSDYKIVDIHEERSHKRNSIFFERKRNNTLDAVEEGKYISKEVREGKVTNSLYYNVLEAVKVLGIIDDEFYSLLAKYGHSKSRVDKAMRST